MVDRCVRKDSSSCDPNGITRDRRSRVIRLGSQREESFLTHLSTIRFSLNIYLSQHQVWDNAEDSELFCVRIPGVCPPPRASHWLVCYQYASYIKSIKIIFMYIIGETLQIETIMHDLLKIHTASYLRLTADWWTKCWGRIWKVALFAQCSVLVINVQLVFTTWPATNTEHPAIMLTSLI